MGGSKVELELEEVMCSKIIMHPTLGEGPNMLNLASCEAGLPTLVHEDFSTMMGFTRMYDPVKL